MYIFNMIINNDSLMFLEKYLNTYSPVGYEVSGQKVWKSYISKYVDDILIDNYGNVVGVLNPNSSYKVVIEAHCDEISWYVNYISDDGFIYVTYNGGSDKSIALSKKVIIHTQDNAKVFGFFGSKAIHLKSRIDDKSIKLEDIFIDVGADSKRDVMKLGISVGDIVTYSNNFFLLNNKYFVGRALDNKIGGFVIAQVVRMLIENNITLPFCLYIVNSVQEEVGLHGAEMISYKLKPNVAIITDVTHDTYTPAIDKKLYGDIKCGLGPVINFAPSVHNVLRKNIIKLAKKNKISLQKLACSRYTGTDTDAFAYSREGVVSSLISIPMKYMHTTVEMVNKKDVEEIIKLFFYIIKDFDISTNYKYIVS